MIKQETFKSVQNLVLENSFGVVDSENNIELEVTVGIKSEDYGWFELYDVKSGGNDWYAEGDLWFDGLNLTDYDGVFCLSQPVIDKLKEWGYNTEEVE